MQCSNRVLKCRWHVKRAFLYIVQKDRIRLSNLKYIVMTSVMLHNLSIDVSYPCLPLWRLLVENISLIRRRVEKREDINLSDANRSQIANWLWNNQPYKGWAELVCKTASHCFNSRTFLSQYKGCSYIDKNMRTSA